MDVLGFVFPLSWILFQVDVLGKTLERFLQLVGKLVEVRCELLLLVLLAFTPVIVRKLVDKRFEDQVDDGVQGIYGVFADLTKKHLVVTAVGLNDFLALGVSEEVTTFAIEFDLLTVGDEELLRIVEILDISGLVDLVRNLIVHKNTI